MLDCRNLSSSRILSSDLRYIVRNGTAVALWTGMSVASSGAHPVKAGPSRSFIFQRTATTTWTPSITGTCSESRFKVRKTRGGAGYPIDHSCILSRLSSLFGTTALAGKKKAASSSIDIKHMQAQSEAAPEVDDSLKAIRNGGNACRVVFSCRAYMTIGNARLTTPLSGSTDAQLGFSLTSTVPNLSRIAGRAEENNRCYA